MNKKFSTRLDQLLAKNLSDTGKKLVQAMQVLNQNNPDPKRDFEMSDDAVDQLLSLIKSRVAEIELYKESKTPENQAGIVIEMAQRHCNY